MYINVAWAKDARKMRVEPCRGNLYLLWWEIRNLWERVYRCKANDYSSTFLRLYNAWSQLLAPVYFTSKRVHPALDSFTVHDINFGVISAEVISDNFILAWNMRLRRQLFWSLQEGLVAPWGRRAFSWVQWWLFVIFKDGIWAFLHPCSIAERRHHLHCITRVIKSSWVKIASLPARVSHQPT